MEIKTVTLETENLLLVPTVMAYVEEIFKNFDQETTKYMFPKSPEKIEETTERINHVLEKREKNEELQMTILDKTTKEFIGNAWLHRIKTKTPELGIWIKKDAYWRKAWREAVWVLIDRWNANLDFDYFVYPVDHRNIPSRKIAEAFWGIAEVDENNQIIISTKETLDPNKTLQTVVYRIHKK